MKILMLGWEYPPHISGGLGTACEGLTRALAAQHVEIDFVVPRLFGAEDAGHMHLLGTVGPDGRPMPAQIRPPSSRVAEGAPEGAPEGSVASMGEGGELMEFLRRSGFVDDPETGKGGRRIEIPALLQPYFTPESYTEVLEALRTAGHPAAQAADPAVFIEAVRSTRRVSHTPHITAETSDTYGSPTADLQPEITDPDVTDDLDDSTDAGGHYGDDLFGEVARFAARAAAGVEDAGYDLVHAHDWMTFPAGIELSKRLDIPLILHVHSLEKDRSGAGANPGIVAIERAGFDAASRIVAVSYFTRRQISEIHGVPLEKISVVHNGVYTPETVAEYTRQRKTSGPVVLFLGRITFQKGPEYFVEAAQLVLEEIPEAIFVMAGSGDMLPEMVKLTEELGIAESFRFPGFVRGPDVERMFSTADVYVMPSVSEPFGITPLEAISYDRPVIISRQSGVSEVLSHALKVDFWDVTKLAGHIVAMLRYPELRESIVAMARQEVRRIHWEAAAEKLIPVYEEVAP